MILADPPRSGAGEDRVIADPAPDYVSFAGAYLVAVLKRGPAAIAEAELEDSRMALHALHPQRGREAGWRVLECRDEHASGCRTRAAAPARAGGTHAAPAARREMSATPLIGRLVVDSLEEVEHHLAPPPKPRRPSRQRGRHARASRASSACAPASRPGWSRASPAARRWRRALLGPRRQWQAWLLQPGQHRRRRDPRRGRPGRLRRAWPWRGCLPEPAERWWLAKRWLRRSAGPGDRADRGRQQDPGGRLRRAPSTRPAQLPRGSGAARKARDKPRAPRVGAPAREGQTPPQPPREQRRRRCSRLYGRTRGQVTELRARALGKTQIELAFSAPGTDGSHPPPARSYVVKQSLRPIRSARSFARAQTLCKGACRFTVSRVGGKVSLTVTDLRPHTAYYYAVAARDNVSAHRGARSQTVKGRTR